MNKTFFSPGKVIITGEHSVVYGYPAVVSAITKGVTVQVTKVALAPRSPYLQHIVSLFSEHFSVEASNVSVSVVSELPKKAGLGSSAAYAHAVMQALADTYSITLSSEQLYDLVFLSEVFIHTNPSGIDPCAVVYGGTHSFIKDTKQMSCTKLTLPQKYSFLLINSGEATETTGEMVQKVADTLKKDPKLHQHCKKIGTISGFIREQLLDGSFTGELLDANQIELESLGVVSQKAIKMIKQLQGEGAHTKITGAGGVTTGSGWLLATSHNLEELQAFCNAQAWENFMVEVQ